MTEICFELSVEILLAVNLVDERVQADAILAVLVKEGDFHNVFSTYLKLTRRQSDVVVLESGLFELNRRIVEPAVTNLDSAEVEEAIS